VPAAQPLPKGTTVLHIGDSFAGALGHELNAELETHGITGVLKYEKSTYIPTWASKKELPVYLAKYQPDLIVVTLGGNELGIGNPEQRAETLQRLVKRFDTTPCVWVGIPLWEGANPRLMQVVAQNVAPCRFLDSHALLPDLERAKDKIHPSLSARRRWALAVIKWLTEQRDPKAEGPWVWKTEKP
jgi:lysophospholipase L1-like esterase